MLSHCTIQRDHLRLWRALGHASLSLRAARDREVREASARAHVRTRRAALCSRASREVCIGIQMWLNVVRVVTNPPVHTMMLSRVDVVDQPVETAIANRGPFRDVARKVTNGTKEIESGHSSSIQNLHEHFRGDRLQSTASVISRARHWFRVGVYIPPGNGILFPLRLLLVPRLALNDVALNVRELLLTGRYLVPVLVQPTCRGNEYRCHGCRISSVTDGRP